MGSIVRDRRREPAPMGGFWTSRYGQSYPFQFNYARMGLTQETTGYRSRPSEVETVDGVVTRNGFSTFDPTYDNGHEFDSIRFSPPRISHPNVGCRGSNSYPDYYQGPLLIVGPTGSSFWTVLNAPPALTSNEVKVWGARAVSLTRPLNPASNVLQTAAELWDEGIPSFTKALNLADRASMARAAGSAYLSVEFGWKPLLSDLFSIVQAVKKSNKLLFQLQRDSGRNIRRRFNFDPIESTTVSAISGNPIVATPPGMPSETSGILGFRGDMGSLAPSAQTRTSYKYWFSGAYTYHVELGNSFLNKLERYEQQANVLLGTRLTPDVLWELAPWSWLADWVGNFGTVLGNVNAFSADGLVMRYGYLMRYTRVDTTYTIPLLRWGQGPFGYASGVTNSFTVTRKERVRATPYGFGLLESGFNPHQWAILGALGMTKHPTSLRYFQGKLQG